MLLDASVRGTMRNKIQDELREVIEKMCQNEYDTQSYRATKKKGMVELDTQTSIL